MPSLEFDPEAEADREDIFLDGLGRFGVAQAYSFQDELDVVFELIASQPQIGRTINVRGTLCRLFARPYPCRILYQTFNDRIVILRIIHGLQDIERALDAL